MPKKHLLTSALPYANGALHLGHLAGAYLPADIYARYLRLQGEDVLFVCGSDEHGAAITLRAKKEGISPREIIDSYHGLNKNSFEKLGISFDIYHRTSAELHHQTAQDFFNHLLEKGDQLEQHTSEQYYDKEYDQFLADRYIKGTCPKCSYENAYGDQCENCGSDLSPTELINPVSTLSGKTPELRETTHWFFRLDKHEEWLRSWLQEGKLDGKQQHDPARWRKHVIGQCLSWLDQGLKPRSITRDLDWGIPVPVEGADGKVLYVWFDAPIGYISATRQWAADHGKDWKAYWQNKNPEELEIIHFIGKDNIVFHCIVFPSMLKAHGDYALPQQVPANQFLNFEGQKFSKSRNWGIEQHQYLEDFASLPNKEDALRYALIRNMPENKDSDFRWDDFVEAHDKDLADNLGNFVNRVLTLLHKYYEGEVPQPANADLSEPLRLFQQIGSYIEAFEFKKALQSFMELSTWGNTFLQDSAPWAIYKKEPESQIIKDCLYTCVQTVGLLSVAAAPFIPFTAARLRAMLALPTLENADWQAANDSKGQLLSAGHRIAKAELLFVKIDDRRNDQYMQLVQAQKEQLNAIQASETSSQQAPLKDNISFDDFQQLDLRTAIILSAEAVPKTDKLLKLDLDLGFEKRTVVSGIAAFYKPEDLPGKQVVIVANLAPKKLRGILSQGMVLMAENADGTLTFVSPEQAGFGGGWVVK